ncbi:hypothetical protein LK429_11835 [Hoylesella buccalis]|nr:hypothetical protein [Hoylesella buccalis]UEA64326.1 hypothetical protein LK429_11835 [Hoylesella buccalis]
MSIPVVFIIYHIAYFTKIHCRS